MSPFFHWYPTYEYQHILIDHLGYVAYLRQQFMMIWQDTKFMFVDTPPHLLKTFLQTVGEASALDGMLYSY
jgi:hypothetical protein